ncbi:MAG: ATP-binding cassette domain-containing protein [Actinobacteria bacterium]|nr:ATP-binding cassette domain-containing protein [Actinomycetota bacterium]
MAGVGNAHLRAPGDALLRVENLVVEYKARGGGAVQAVSGASIDVVAGETVAVVGESGCGKTTLAKGVMQLIQTASGSVMLDGADLTKLKGEDLRKVRPKIQMIFQDSISSLDPHLKVRALVEQPLKVWGRGNDEERLKKVDELLRSVNMDPEIVGDRKPTEFSGGQCQRISIARALSLEPKILICDEPVSSLDVSIQSQILNIIQDMKKRYGLSLLFISHDLSVVRAISDRIVVMYLGKICEVSTPDKLANSPAHHYTHALVSAVPVPDPKLGRRKAILQGEPPSPTNPPSGCRFRTRCPAATEKCTAEEPQLREVSPGQFVACHHPRG